MRVVFVPFRLAQLIRIAFKAAAGIVGIGRRLLQRVGRPGEAVVLVIAILVQIPLRVGHAG